MAKFLVNYRLFITALLKYISVIAIISGAPKKHANRSCRIELSDETELREILDRQSVFQMKNESWRLWV
jgi:hypothetical protein